MSRTKEQRIANVIRTLGNGGIAQEDNWTEKEITDYVMRNFADLNERPQAVTDAYVTAIQRLPAVKPHAGLFPKKMPAGVIIAASLVNVEFGAPPVVKKAVPNFNHPVCTTLLSKDCPGCSNIHDDTKKIGKREFVGYTGADVRAARAVQGVKPSPPKLHRPCCRGTLDNCERYMATYCKDGVPTAFVCRDWHSTIEWEMADGTPVEAIFSNGTTWLENHLNYEAAQAAASAAQAEASAAQDAASVAQAAASYYREDSERLAAAATMEQERANAAEATLAAVGIFPTAPPPPPGTLYTCCGATFIAPAQCPYH
jgi:hypothetical protein